MGLNTGSVAPNVRRRWRLLPCNAVKSIVQMLQTHFPALMLMSPANNVITNGMRV